MSEDQEFLNSILNLSKYHREHEKFYAKAPLKQAVELQKASQILKTLADRWANIEVKAPEKAGRYMGCEDLNETASIQYEGVLFMEGEVEPPEISRLKRDLKNLADDFGETGDWLAKAMEGSWKVAQHLIKNPEIADVLGERHRIIANDWQAAYLSSLTSKLILRSLDILEMVDFSPAVIRTDLSGPRFFPKYLYSASELIDRAADTASESATLVHDNERRWRIFRRKVKQLTGKKTR